MAARFFIALVKFYRLVFSAWVGRGCRYIPTRSEYSIEAFERFGAVKGLYLTVMRILRCHPLGGRGWDPVPKRFRWDPWRHDPDEVHHSLS